MPRALRQEYPGAVYHVMCRGNNGQEIFRSDDGRRLFLAALAEVCSQTGWRVHAYVLMPNHYHLLLETPEANLVAGMKWFQGTYTQRFNAMFKYRGHLFQGRYKALPVETEGTGEYFREVGQYIHLNPFRAGLAGTERAIPLESYAWSSYPAYAGKVRKPPEWLILSRLQQACGLNAGGSGCIAGYRKLVELRISGDAGSDGAAGTVTKQLKHGWFIGSEAFKNKLAGMIFKRTDNLRGSQRHAHDENEAERLLGLALAGMGVSERDLLAMKSTRPEKQALVWLLKSRTTVTAVWLASRLDMGHRTNVSRAISAFSKAKSKKAKVLKDKML